MAEWYLEVVRELNATEVAGSNPVLILFYTSSEGDFAVGYLLGASFATGLQIKEGSCEFSL